MMKNAFTLILICITFNVFAAKKDENKNELDKKNERQKVYQVDSDNTQLEFGMNTSEKSGSFEYWYVAISRSGINYKIPSLINLTSDFSNNAVGFTLGKKQSDLILNIPGYYEYSFEWQNYERSAATNTQYSYNQKLNILKLNLYQNYPMASAFQKSLFLSFGVGLSPLISTLDQTALSNSETNLGILATMKTNLSYPIKYNELTMFSYMAIDLELSASVGSLGGQNLNMSAIKLGTNINW